jgi:flagellar biosynthetic protein FlhB
VALRYDTETMQAPRVIAKGADYMAQRIRLVATASGVPIIERPPLARGLYFGTDPGQEISSEYYEAVAEILAYVYRLEGESNAAKRRVHERKSERAPRSRKAAGVAG